MHKNLFMKWLSVLLVISLLSCTSIATQASETNELVMDAEVIGILKNDLSADIYGIVCDELDINVQQPQSLPNTYAGAYIDENDQLHLYVTKGNLSNYEQTIDEISVDILLSPYTAELAKRRINTAQNSIKNIKDTIAIHEVVYSYKYLHSLMEQLYLAMDQLGIVEIDINQPDNCLFVKIKDLSFVNDVHTYLSTANPSYDSNAVQIVEGQESTEYMSRYAYNGDQVSWSSATSFGSGSVGFNGTFVDYQGNSHYGVVTNAHVAPLHQTMNYGPYAEETLGKCILHVKGGSVDLAFIEFNSSDWVRTSSLKGSSIQKINAVASASDLVVGRRVVMYGSSTGSSAGTIRSISNTLTVAGVQYYDLFKTSCSVNNGDSGGTVVVNSVGSTTNKLLGIVSARDNTNEEMIGVKYSNIQTFGVTAYIN